MNKTYIVIYKYKFLFFSISVIKKFRWLEETKAFLINKIIPSAKIYEVYCYVDSFYTKYDIYRQAMNEYLELRCKK